MTFHLTSVIKDAKFIHCTLSTDANDVIVNPVLCLSLQAPARVVSGAAKIEGLGGFTALRLNGQLDHNTPLSFVLGFEDPYFWVSNRAWHPQGPYLRLSSGAVEVAMDIHLGVKLSPAPPIQMPKSGLALVPAPTSWVAQDGSLDAKAFDISGVFGAEADSIDRLCLRRGLPTLGGGKIPLRIQPDTSLPLDGYRLSITDAVTLQAQNAVGAFYGLITLLNLRETHVSLPCGVITDAPRFSWRGFMLDCVREFYPVDAILKLLDLMALLKLNRFHWHFSDDEAFRIETQTAPDLWQKSGFRGEGCVLPGVFGGRPGPTGGTYSTDDVARVIAHAATLQIDILPEIEVPAHALALTAIRPDLRDHADRGTEASVQGYPRNVVNPAIDATWDLLEPLACEVAGMFPFGHLHLGGDELPAETWLGSPLVDSYKKAHGLKTHQDVQGHLMNRLARHVADAGFTPCAWQEAADGCAGGIQNDAILFSWTGAGPGLRAARKGYRVVMCPAQHTYFDMAHSPDPDDWGANWAANYALDGAFEWDPIPEGADDIADQFIGVEGTFWSEFTSDPAQYEPMIAPRILALATKAWSMPQATDLATLRQTATCYMPFFDRIGWAAHGAAIFMDTPNDAVRRVDPA